MEIHSPTEAALLPAESVESTDLSDYREQRMVSLSSARELAARTIRTAQQKYKRQCDKKSRPLSFRLRDWVLVHFPQEESGKQRKLSRPRHGPYRIIAKNDLDVTMVKVYFQGKFKYTNPECVAAHLTCWFLLVWWKQKESRTNTTMGTEVVQEDEQNSDQEASESFKSEEPSEECVVELEDEKSSTSEPESESVELEPDPQPIVKQRVPLSSAKGCYSLRDRIVAPQRLV